jgi:hypothetical protein
MTIRITTWRPDTCDCVTSYSWDDSLPQDQITLTFISIQKCPLHENISNDQTAFTAVDTENKKKNQSFDEILQNAPNTNWFDIDAQTGSRVLKKNITFRWTWSGTAPNRTLTIFFDGITLTTQQRTNLQNRLNTRFGTGNIVLG